VFEDAPFMPRIRPKSQDLCRRKPGDAKEGMRMVVLTMTVRLHAPWCHSLKDKRSEVKMLLSRLRGKFNLSAAETGEQDALCLIELGIAAIAFSSAQADSIAETVMGFIQSNTDAEIISADKELR
jgi:uncharacterized protein